VPALIWTPRALADLDRLHVFLAERERNAARRAIRASRDGMRLIAAHPEAGRPVEGLDPAFRERWISFGGGGYLTLYRLDGPRVVVLAVRHGREIGY
jgi:plasmid stabilization system protein ParE